MRSVSLGRRAACAVAGTTLFAGLMSAAGGVSSAAASSGLSPAQVARDVLSTLHVGSPDHAVHLPGITGPAVSSTNWAGYADTNSSGNTYKKVSASWTEPSVTCIRNTDTEAAVFWVGIDGFSSNTVEQAGTAAICQNGAITYADWWENFPANPVIFVNTISAGDSISSSVALTAAGTYKMTVTDSTHPADSFTTTQACGSSSCANSSAEWIAERPSSGSSLLVLPHFTTWGVKRAKVTSGATNGVISTFPDDSITMVNSSNQVLVSVSALNAAGNAFKAVWHRSA